MLETQGMGILLLLSIAGLTNAQLGRSCNDPSVCQNGATECFYRPLSPAEADTEANYVCDCSSSQTIGFGCEVFGPSHRRDMPEESFQTCYGNDCRSGSFKSINYPSPYKDRWMAIYLLYIPGATRITFTFSGEGGFGVESYSDELYVGTGLTFSPEDFSGTDIVTGDREIRFFDNTTLFGRTFPPPFSFESDAAWFYFATDKNIEWNGWCIAWQSDVDSTPPVITDCPLNIVTTLQRGQPQFISVTWNEPRGNDPSHPVTTVSTHNPGDLFVLGTTTVTYTFTDRLENQAMCSFDVTIIEGEAGPEVSMCPTSMNFSTCDMEYEVSWRPPKVVNNSDSDLVIWSSHSPGDTFKIGNTVVIYTFEDQFGSVAQCNFQISVNESTDNCGGRVYIIYVVVAAAVFGLVLTTILLVVCIKGYKKVKNDVKQNRDSSIYQMSAIDRQTESGNYPANINLDTIRHEYLMSNTYERQIFSLDAGYSNVRKE